MRHSLAVKAVIGVLASLALGSIPLLAQDQAGLEANATLSFGALYDDDALKAYSGFGFSLSSSTRTQGFGLSVTGGVEATEANGLDLVDPSVLLTYNRIGQNARFDVSARYRETDLGGFTVDEDTSAGELIATTGAKQDTHVAGALEFGTQSPFGGKIDMGWRQVRYSGATTLADYESRDVGAMLRFSIDPNIDLRTTARYQETQADAPGTDRIVKTAGIGADFRVNATLSTSFDLTWSEVETRPAGGTVQTESGPGFSFSAEKDLKNGNLGFYLTSTVTTIGNRTDAQISRELELAQGDSLSFSLGASRGGDGDVSTIYGLEYARSVRDSELSLAVSQGVQSDLFGQETLVSLFRVGHSYEINETSRLQSSLAYRETEFLNSPALDSRKLELSLGYSHELTTAFDLTAELAQTRSWTGSLGPTTDSSVFVGLTRAFNWRP